jgi:short-subunit dehydrogenase
MKSAIVTGASGNLGSKIVSNFIKGEYHVTGTIAPGEHMKTDFPKDKFECVEVDLLDSEATENFIRETIKKRFKIDTAVLTVGGFAMGNISETTIDDMRKQYQLNFETTYNSARPVFMHMMEQDYGRIFIIGSKPGLSSRFARGMTAYSLSKSLVFRLAELMNEEAKGKNVVTSVVVPSTIDTIPNRKSMPDADFDRWVKPESIAEIIYWHSSPEADSLREPILKVYNKS